MNKVKHCLFIVVFLTLVSSVEGVNKRPFLWEVKSKSTRAYILGSIHVGKRKIYPLHPTILKSFNSSDVLVMETDKSEDDLDFNSMKYIKYPFGTTLKQNISKKTYKLVKKTAKDLNLSMVLLNRFRPWFVAFTITYKKLDRDGFGINYGIEKYFILLNSEKKEILGLEDGITQMKLFNDFSPSLQEKFLYYTIKDLSLVKGKMNKLLYRWSIGDVRAFKKLFFDDIYKNLALAPIYEKLIDKRNTNMVNKIEGFLKTKKTYFIIVGAGHIVGRKGIINLLLKKGYNVKQL